MSEIPAIPLNTAELVYAALGHTLDQAEANGGRVPLHVIEAMRRVCGAYNTARANMLVRKGIPPAAVEVHATTSANRIRYFVEQQRNELTTIPERQEDFEQWAQELLDDDHA